MLQWSMLDERLAYHKIDGVEVLTIWSNERREYVTTLVGGAHNLDERRSFDKETAMRLHRRAVAELLAGIDGDKPC